jgi:hypothetical protein
MVSTRLTDALPPGTALIEALEQHRENVLVKIRDANGMTEREVLAVGVALRQIVDEARSYVAHSQQTLEHFASANVADLLQRHGNTKARLHRKRRTKSIISWSLGARLNGLRWRQKSWHSTPVSRPPV